MTVREPPTRSAPTPAAATGFQVGRPRSRGARGNKDRVFVIICVTAASLSVLVLIVLLASIFYSGFGRLTAQFLTGVPSRFVDQAGIWPAMMGTLAICLVCGVTAVPIGVATAILLEEFRPKHPFLRQLHGLVQLNITNLAGVPSIVYGILGLTVFVSFFNLAGGGQRPAYEVGTAFYDRFVMVDRRTAMVRVAGRDAPETTPDQAIQFVDDSHRPTTVKVTDAATIGARVRALEDQLDAYLMALEGRIDDLRQMTQPGALEAELAAEWKKAAFTTEFGVIGPVFTKQVAEGIARPGREGKKALRTAVKDLTATLAATEFPNTLLSDAKPSRVQEPRPWYLRVPFGRSVLAGGLTLMLVILPIIIISTQEAFRAVSNAQRQASLALGATKWQTIWNVTLPSALPGVMTGVILAMSRAIGEAAPVLIIAGIVYITFTPRHLMDDFTAMPLQIYQWASLPQQPFHEIAAAGIIVLLAILLCFNGVAIFIRQRTQKQG